MLGFVGGLVCGRSMPSPHVLHMRLAPKGRASHDLCGVGLMPIHLRLYPSQKYFPQSMGRRIVVSMAKWIA